MDRPGFYVYLRDDDTGEYWSVSWQPVGLPLDRVKYRCRHGLSYSVYTCSYSGIDASQKVFIPADDPVMLWDVKIKNTDDKPRQISVFSYLEFSFHHIEMDNKNHQMSLYSSGSGFEDGMRLALQKQSAPFGILNSRHRNNVGVFVLSLYCQHLQQSV